MTRKTHFWYHRREGTLGKIPRDLTELVFFCRATSGGLPLFLPCRVWFPYLEGSR